MFLKKFFFSFENFADHEALGHKNQEYPQEATHLAQQLHFTHEDEAQRRQRTRPKILAEPHPESYASSLPG